MSNTPRDINSGQPFSKMVLEYHAAGWYPIPLQPKRKEPFETGYTGRKNEFAADELANINDWLERVPKNCNIGLWLRDGVIGIDVDDYIDKDGKKHVGGRTLRELEAKLGRLPETWVSSARLDGTSGIRFFKVPTGYEWSGKAGENIDIVQRVHRYAVTYPSYHPDTGGVYHWFRPGTDISVAPSIEGHFRLESKVLTGLAAAELGAEGVERCYQRTLVPYRKFPIPTVDELPELPESWVEFLTRGYQEATEHPIDMDSTTDEVMEWALTKLSKPKLAREKWCTRLEKSYAKRIEDIKVDLSSHDKIRDTHWELISMGMEGHQGWWSAVQRFEKFWTTNVMRRGKRSMDSASREMYRSRTNAIRKRKAEVELKAAEGVNSLNPRCGCFRPGEVPKATSQGSPDPTGRAHDPSEYRLNDDGNGAHLIDLYQGNLIWVPGYGQWMFWNGQRWIRDEGELVRRCYWVVRDRQEAYAQVLLQAYLDAKASGDEQALKDAKAKYQIWKDHSRKSGTNFGANGAITAAKAIDGVKIPAESLDKNPRLLGVNNGIVELTKQGARFRKAKHDDYVTVNTGVDYLDPVQLAQAGGDVAKGRELWANYRRQFLPTSTTREGTLARFIQTVMGYCLMGQNPERLAVFLYGGTSTGKSTLLSAVMSALGEYSITVDLSIFKERESGLNPALAQAMSTRIITSSEAGLQNHMHADLFKRMTGNDALSAELKGVNTIIRKVPDFTPIIATNSPPVIKGADFALKQRLCVLPMDTRVASDKDDKMASHDLATYGREAVLTWLIEGWNMYCANGLKKENWPEAVLQSTDDFAADLNDIGRFVSDCTERIKPTPSLLKRDYAVTVHAMYDRYMRWCMAQNVPERDRLTKAMFGRHMAANGFTQTMVKGDDEKMVRSWAWVKVIESGVNIKGIASVTPNHRA